MFSGGQLGSVWKKIQCSAYEFDLRMIKKIKGWESEVEERKKKKC